MIRRLLATAFLLGFAHLCAWTQELPSAPKPMLAPRVFTVFGTFERVREGWQCKYAGQSRPSLFHDLQVGDVLVSVDREAVDSASAIALLQHFRLLEFGLAGEVEVVRTGQRLKWSSAVGLPQILASQHSLRVLRSTVPEVRAGDTLIGIGQATFMAILGRVENPLTSVVTVEAHQGRTLHVSREGRQKDIVVTGEAVVRLLQFDVDMAQATPSDTLLSGLNTGNASIGSFGGRWSLLHFWATWCVPCMHHMPVMRELAQQPGLTVAAIGFADTRERLAAAAAQERDLKVYAPDLELQRKLAITGIPFDVLLDPEGGAALVVSGDMPAEKFRAVVMQYVRQ